MKFQNSHINEVEERTNLMCVKNLKKKLPELGMGPLGLPLI